MNKSRYAKEKIIMIGLMIILIIIIIKITSGAGDLVSKESVFTSLKTNDAKTGTATFTLSNPEALALPQESLKINFKEECGSVKSYKILTPTTCTRQDPIIETIQDCKTQLNKTTNKEEETCNPIEHLTGYKEISYACEKEIDYIDGTKDYRIKADIKLERCPDGSYGYKIDWIPSLTTDTKGIISREDWAWWNTSYSTRLTFDCSKIQADTTGSLDVILNGSAGITLNGTTLYIHTICNSTNSPSLYGNITNFIIADDNGNILPYYNESGSPNYNYRDVSSNRVQSIYPATDFSDKTTKNNNLTNSGIDQVAGLMGGAWSSSWADVDDAYDTSWTNQVKDNLTLIMWLKPTALRNGMYASMAYNTESVFTLRTRSITDGSTCYEMTETDGSYVGSSNWCSDTKATAGGWYMFAITYDDATMNMYINNTLDKTQSDTCASPLNATNLRIGYYTGGSNSYDGLIDEMRIYNSSLSANEIGAIYNNTKPGGSITGYASTSGWEENLPDPEASPPIVSFSTNTTPTGTYYLLEKDWIYISTRTETMDTGKNTTIKLYNDTNLISTTTTNINGSNNFTGLSNANYKINLTTNYETYSNNKMISYYMFDDNQTLPTDQQGYYDMTNNTGSYGTGKYGQGLELDGVSDQTHGSTAYFTGVQQFTMCAWLYPKNMSGTYGWAVGNNYVEIFRYNNAWRLTAANLTDTSISNSAGIAWDTWNFVCGGWNGTHIFICRNATCNYDASTGYLNTGSLPLYIGYDGDSVRYFFNGTIDEVMIFNRSLTASEIYEAFITPPGTNSNETINITLYEHQNPSININNPITRNLISNYTETSIRPTGTGITITTYNVSLDNPGGTYNTSLYNGATNNSINFDTFNHNLSIDTYLLRINSTDSEGITSTSTANANITRNAQLNISASNTLTGATITAFSINITDYETGIQEDYASTDNKTSIEIIKGHNYNITIDAPGYALDNKTYNASTNETYQQTNFSLYTTNSVYIYIYDEATLELINGTLISLTFTDNTTATTASTTNGTYYKEGLSDGTWQIKFYSTIYAYRVYTISVANRSTQTLNAYLANSNYTAVFTISNCLTTGAVSGANFIMQRLANTSYIITENRLSDITGRVQVGYIGATEYQFIVSKTGFTTKTFTLDPIIFNSYTICLDPDTEQDSTYDYEQLSIIYYPKTFINNQINNFHYTISSPTGSLTNYSVRLIAPGDDQYETGALANGQSYTIPLNITGATFYDRVNLTYTYTTTTGGSHTFRFALEIINTGEANGTIIKLKESDYGLGLFETGLLATLAIVVAVGLSYALVGMGGALLLGLLMQGIAVYLGFLPLASILISVFIGILLLIAVSTKS